LAKSKFSEVGGEEKRLKKDMSSDHNKNLQGKRLRLSDRMGEGDNLREEAE